MLYYHLTLLALVPHTSIWLTCIYARLLRSIQLFVTLWTRTCQAPLSMGFSRQLHWSGLLFPPPGDLPDPGMEPGSPALAGGFFTTLATWEAQCIFCILLIRLCLIFMWVWITVQKNSNQSYVHMHCWNQPITWKIHAFKSILVLVIWEENITFNFLSFLF